MLSILNGVPFCSSGEYQSVNIKIKKDLSACDTAGDRFIVLKTDSFLLQANQYSIEYQIFGLLEPLLKQLDSLSV